MLWRFLLLALVVAVLPTGMFHPQSVKGGFPFRNKEDRERTRLVREHDPRLGNVERGRQPSGDAAREAATRGGLERGQVGDKARWGPSSREEELESLVEGELQAGEGDLGAR